MLKLEASVDGVTLEEHVQHKSCHVFGPNSVDWMRAGQSDVCEELPVCG